MNKKWNKWALCWWMNVWLTTSCYKPSYVEFFLAGKLWFTVLFCSSKVFFHSRRSEVVSPKRETLSWLKSRLKILIEVSSEDEAQKQGGRLAKLSSSFKAPRDFVVRGKLFTHTKRKLWLESGRFPLGFSLTNNFI